MGLANLVARTSIAPRNAPASAPDLRKKQGCKADLMKRAALGIDREQLELAERLVRESEAHPHDNRSRERREPRGLP